MRVALIHGWQRSFLFPAQTLCSGASCGRYSQRGWQRCWLMNWVAPLFTPARRSCKFAIFERTSSNPPRSRCRRGSVSPYEAPPGRVKHCCCAPSPTLIPVTAWCAWAAATALRSPDRNGDAWSAMCRRSPAGGRMRSASTSVNGRRHLPLSETSGFPRRRRLGRSPACRQASGCGLR